MSAWFKNKEEKQLDAFVDYWDQIVRLFRSDGRLSGKPMPEIEGNINQLRTEAAVYISCMISCGATTYSKEPDASSTFMMRWLEHYAASHTIIDPESGRKISQDVYYLGKRVDEVYREYLDVFIQARDPDEDSDNRQSLVTELALRFYKNVVADSEAHLPFIDIQFLSVPFFVLSIDVSNSVERMV
jgi:hypothetical protein